MQDFNPIEYRLSQNRTFGATAKKGRAAGGPPFSVLVGQVR
jgi:hypothetical protein